MVAAEEDRPDCSVEQALDALETTGVSADVLEERSCPPGRMTRYGVAPL
jgi:hypothetical protein